MNKVLFSKAARQFLSLVLLMTIMLVALTSAIHAEKNSISLQEAIELGQKNNYELAQQEQALKAMERERDLLQAKLSWQSGLTSNLSYLQGSTYGEMFKIYDLEGYLQNPTKDSGGTLELSLESNKTTLSGITISSTLSLREMDPFSFKNLDDKYLFKLNINKRLYPLLPSEAEKQFMQIENNYKLGREKLRLSRREKEIDWLEAYLKHLRLKQRLEIARINKELAQENLAKVKKQQDIQEAGKEQLLMAEISLKEAEIQYEELMNSLVQAQNSFFLDLGLYEKSDELELELNENDEFLRKMMQQGDALNINYDDLDALMSLLEKNSTQLRELRLEIEYTDNELEWQKREDQIKVDVAGGYEYSGESQDNYQISLGLAYDFLDGGQQKLLLEGIEEKKAGLITQYQHTREQLKNQLLTLLAQRRLNSMGLQSKEIALEKVQMELQLVQKQYKEGLLTTKQWEEKQLQLKQAEVDYKEAQDKLLINQLRLACLLGLY